MITNNTEMELPDLKLKKMIYLNSQFDILGQNLKSNYSDIEIQSWSKQEVEARNYLLNNEFKTPLLDSICNVRNIEKSELVDKIIKKSDSYSDRVGSLIGRLKIAINKVNDAKTFEDLNKIVF